MKLSYKDGNAGKIHIYIDDEYKMTADDTFWFSERWHNLINIDDEELAELESAVSSRRAFLSGADMLSRRIHGIQELHRKLCRKYSKEAAREAVDKLESLGLLDDKNYAEMLANDLYKYKKYGLIRVEQELLRRGIDRETAKDAVEKLDKNDINRIILLLQTKYQSKLCDRKGINSAKNSLLRLGYSYSDIRAALSEINTDAEEFYDE